MGDDGEAGEHDNVLNIEHLIGGSAADSLLEGAAGNDTITGLGGDDVLSGGAGNDTITGGTGSDTIGCGAGVDTVVADAADTVAADCEHVTRPAGPGTGPGSTGAPAKVTLPAKVTFRGGAARVRISCPATAAGGCAAGRLTLVETAPKKRTLASATFSLAAGDGASVTLKLGPGKRRALRRVKHLKAGLTATARDSGRHSATASRAVKLKL